MSWKDVLVLWIVAVVAFVIGACLMHAVFTKAILNGKVCIVTNTTTTVTAVIKWKEKEPPIVNKQMLTYAPLKVFTWDEAHVEEHSDGTVTLHLEEGKTQLHFAKVSDALIWVRSNLR
jgi:hypothetical protein